jgi:phospholipid/cholesterol/gamma-HCH transport system substrate-binding protein
MRRATVLPVAGAVAVALTGCGSSGFAGVYNLPLPGGADLGDHPYTVVAEFADVLDLVPQAAVRVNNVAVGRVTAIDLPAEGWTARVTMQVNGSVRLPADATAQLKQSSLLGEKYVQLAPPSGRAPGAAAPGTPAAAMLVDGATIPLARTNRNPEVEEVLGALSLLLNGGGIEQVHTISTELSDAMRDNEPELRGVLSKLDTLVSSLDAEKQHIVDALDGLDRLSATLAARNEQIGDVLDDLAPGLKVLDEQRESFVEMLQALDRLSAVAVRTIEAGQEDFVANLRALQPILRQLANAGQALPQALEVLLTYPFSDAVLDGIKGDYLNIYLSVVAQPGTTIIAPLVPDGPLDTGEPGSGATNPPSAPGTAPLIAPPLPLPGIASPSTGAPSAGAPSGSPSVGTPGSPSVGTPSTPPAQSPSVTPPESPAQSPPASPTDPPDVTPDTSGSGG